MTISNISACVLLAANALAAATIVPTFECAGLYWSPVDGGTGVVAAVLLTRRAEKNENETAITAGEGIKLGVLVFGLLRAIASLGDD